MKKYDVAYIKDDRFWGKITGIPNRGTEEISGEFKYGAWDISYESVAPGLIVYSCDYNRKRAQKAAATTLVIAVGVGLAFVGIPCPPPVFIPIPV